MAHSQNRNDTPDLRLRCLTECPPPQGTYPNGNADFAASSLTPIDSPVEAMISRMSKARSTDCTPLTEGEPVSLLMPDLPSFRSRLPIIPQCEMSIFAAKIPMQGTFLLTNPNGRCNSNINIRNIFSALWKTLANVLTVAAGRVGSPAGEP